VKRLATLLLAAALAACAGEEAEETGKKKAGAAGRDDGFRIEIRDTGGAGGASSAATARARPRPSPPASTELRFRTRIPATEFDMGEEIPLKLSAMNVGRTPIRMYRPEKELVSSIRFDAITPRGTKRTVGYRMKIPEQSITEEDLVTIEPGHTVTAEMDLMPVLRDAATEEYGEYTVQAVFDGGQRGKHLTMDLWNRAGDKEVRGPEFKVTLRWPPGLTSRGITPEIDVQVTTILGDTGPDGRLPKEGRAVLELLGEEAWPAVVRKLALAASSRHPRQVIGWNAYHVLRDQGAKVVPFLREAEDTESPLREMLIEWIEISERRGARLEPVGEHRAFRDAVIPPENRGGTAFRLFRSADQGRRTETITVAGDGLVTREVMQGGEASSVSGMLEQRGHESFLIALVEHRFWLQRGVRRHGSRREALLLLEQLDVSGDEERIVRRIEVWETEAKLMNRSLNEIVKAFRAATKVLED